MDLLFIELLLRLSHVNQLHLTHELINKVLVIFEKLQKSLTGFKCLFLLNLNQLVSLQLRREPDVRQVRVGPVEGQRHRPPEHHRHRLRRHRQPHVPRPTR